MIRHALAGLLLLTAVPTVANAQIFGDIEGNISYSWLGGDELNAPEADRLFAGGGQARMGMVVGRSYVLQGDVFGEITNRRSDDTYVSGFGGAAHLAWRDPRQGALGIFGGALVTDQDNDRTDSSVRGFVGVEGQLFRSSTTLYGQAGWFGGSGGNDDQGKDSFRDAGFVRGVLRYFFNPTTMLEAELSGAWGKMDIDNDDASLYGWGLKLEQQFASNWSASVGYSGANYHQAGEGNVTEQIVRLGLKYHFTSGTLLSRDRSGASFDTPAFMRWSGQTGGPLE